MTFHFPLDLNSEHTYFFVMGTLNDGKAWLNDTLGDAPRVNSLVKVGQTEGILVTHGRGRGSPALSASDYAVIICMALMHDGPTKAPHVVPTLRALPLSLVAIDPGDGLSRQMEPEDAIADTGPVDDGDLPRPGFFLTHYLGQGLNPDLTLTGALEALFGDLARRQDFHRFDRLELIEAHDQRSVTLSLHGPEYGQAMESPDAHMLQLTFGDIHPGGPGALRTTRTIYGDALTALAGTTRGGE